MFDIFLKLLQYKCMAKKEAEKTVVVKKKYQGDSGGFAYFLGFIGAAVYYIQQANSFWEGVIGVLKAFVWPAFLAYGLLDFLNL